MEFFRSIYRCAPLSDLCVIDWNAWAAIASFLAAAIALFIARSSSREARDLRKQEATDQLARVKAFTQPVAKTISAETYRAYMEIEGMKFFIAPMTLADFARVRAMYPGPIAPEAFAMTERFVDRLEGFKTVDAIAVLNVLSSWKALPAITVGFFESSPELAISRKAAMLAHLDGYADVLADLMKCMESYIADIPGMQFVSVAEVLDMNKQRADAFDPPKP